MPDILHVTVKGVTYDVPVVGGGAVSSVNGQTGNVVLDADDVGALPDNTVIPSKTSDLTNDSGFITGYTETDPTVPAWAKATNKPSYTASEVGAVPTTRTVNGKALSSNISLSASDVGALPSGTAIPSKTSDLTNDSGFITGYTETDPTVPSWAKASQKPSYTAQEVGAMPAVDDVTLEDDATNGGVISLYDTNDTLRQKLDGNGALWQYDTNGKERTYLEYGDIYLKNGSEVTRQHLDSQGILHQFDTSGKKRTALEWGDLYLLDSTEAVRFRAYGGSSGGGVRLSDASGTTRNDLATDGLKFYNASGTQTSIYPPEGALGWIKWTSSNVLGPSSFALENCSGTIANVAVQLWVDSVNKVACIEGRIRINNFSRTGSGPGVTLSSSFGGRSDQPSWHGGVVCNQNGIIPSENVYLQLDYYGTLHIKTTESVVNFSGTAMTMIIPQTFIKY